MRTIRELKAKVESLEAQLRIKEEMIETLKTARCYEVADFKRIIANLEERLNNV